MDPSPAPFTTGRHFTALFLNFSFTFDYSVVVVGGGGGVFFFQYLSFSILRCAFCEYTSALRIIVDVPYCDKKPEIGTNN